MPRLGPVVFFSGAPLTKDSDLHMSDGVCKQCTTSARAQHATFFSCVPLYRPRCLHGVTASCALCHEDSLVISAPCFILRCWRTHCHKKHNHVHHDNLQVEAEGSLSDTTESPGSRQTAHGIDKEWIQKNRGPFSRAAEFKSEEVKSVRRKARKANEGVEVPPV